MNKFTIFALLLCFGPTCLRADDSSSKSGSSKAGSSKAGSSKSGSSKSGSSKAIDSWPQWRGPESNGVAPHADPTIEWDGKTNIKWKLPIAGQGKATPIVWGDRVFVLSAVKTERKAEKKTTSDAAFTQHSTDKGTPRIPTRRPTPGRRFSGILGLDTAHPAP